MVLHAFKAAQKGMAFVLTLAQKWLCQASADA
jgi:hypothetical protein